jgi:hypothetical protein
MSPPIYDFDEPFRPPEGKNNLWFYDGNKERVLVFVHGILSDSRDCWYREKTDVSKAVYWPDLVRKDPRLSEYSIYLGGYRTGIDSPDYKVEDCAEELVQALKRPDEKNGSVVVAEENEKHHKGHKTIVFVCHSMGGIVVRYMLTARPWDFRNSNVALALIASPSLGSAWANRLDLLIRYFRHKQGATLRIGNSILTDLDSRFRILMEGKGIPNLEGREGCEESFIVKARWGLRLDPVVPREQNAGFFGRVRMLAGTDHFSCVKPGDTGDGGHQLLADFCNDLEKQGFHQRVTTGPTPVTVVPGLFSATSTGNGPTVCNSFHWDIDIDEEGDAYNEMTYVRVVTSAAHPNVFVLPPGEVQSGHTSPYDLIRDDRTSIGAELEFVAETATKIQMQVRFGEAPTADLPASFCLASRDWNVYAMNMEEYRQKPGWRADGLDFAEKLVDERWGTVSLVIRFPQQIIFARTPFFEIHYPTDDFIGKRHDKLTAEYQHCFYYSRHQREAVLVVPSPPSPFSYRIAWLIGESRVQVTSPLDPGQRGLQGRFARKLLKMRRDLSSGQGDVPGSQRIEKVVNQTLATVAEYLQTRIGADDPLDPATLELSIMVLDEENLLKSGAGSKELPALRIVAGTRLEDAGYRDLALFVGDGNAGRAWKRRMARIYDDDAEDPKRHIYVPLPNLPRHRFLVSIPLLDESSAALVFGILNIGTFSQTQAKILRVLNSPEEIERLATYAQSYVLTRLLQELNI